MTTLTVPVLSGLLVERAKSDELHHVSRLFGDLVLSLPYYNDVAKSTEIDKYSEGFLKKLIRTDPDSVLVARVGDELAGFCFSEIDDGIIWLSWFGVGEQFRRMGIGSALLHNLDETVRSGRSHKIWCDCRTENDVSATVLQRHGFAPLCTVRNHWYGQDFILWEKFVR